MDLARISRFPGNFLTGKYGNPTYRDVKPQNVLAFWSNDGNDSVCNLSHVVLKLCDFGYSRHVPDDTITMTAVGTRQYLAPEVATAVATNNPFRGSYKRADVFSLGLVFLQLLLNEVPENSSEALNLTLAHTIGEKKSKILAKMLSWESKERTSANGAVRSLKYGVARWSRPIATEGNTIYSNTEGVKGYWRGIWDFSRGIWGFSKGFWGFSRGVLRFLEVFLSSGGGLECALVAVRVIY